MIQRILLVLLASGSAVYAQLDPSILVQPWSTNAHWAETRDELLLQDTADVRGTAQEADIFSWDSTGRIKINRATTEPNLVIGYRILSLAVDSDLAAINGSFWDTGLLVGGKVGEVGDGWQVWLLGGGGSANDGAFSNSDALYGLGGIHLAKKINDQSDITAGLYYDGHRLYLPDFPLPYVAYRREVSDQFTAVLGLPMGGAYYRPCEPVVITVRYQLPTEVALRVSYAFAPHVMVFAEYARVQDGFAINHVDNRRLFYEARRVWGGVRWITRLFDLSAGAGYAFDQEFEVGFDQRDTASTAKLSDVPFVQVRIDGTF